MPTYQYACTECDHQLEAVQSFSDAPLSECPTCQGRLRKLFNSVGIVFKGSWFYRNDSRSKEKEAPATGATGSTDKAAGNGAGKGSTESAAKPATDTANGSSKSGGSSSAGSSGGTAKAAAGSGGSTGGSASGA